MAAVVRALSPVAALQEQPPKKPRLDATERSRVRGLHGHLGTCFDISQLPRTSSRPAKKKFTCKFCGSFCKVLEGNQRALEHAMGCTTKGKPVKGCVVRGTAEAGKTGIPKIIRDNLRKFYGLANWSFEDMAHQKTRKPDPPEHSQALRVKGCVQSCCLIVCDTSLCGWPC
jgi:hypothetical protein